MKTHELHRLLADIIAQLKQEYPSHEFKPEADDNAVCMLITFPEGGKGKFRATITDDDAVVPQPRFHSADLDVKGNILHDEELHARWLTLLSESIKVKGFEYFYDEIGGEG